MPLTLKRSLNKHALTDARSIRCDVKPTADAFTQPNRHLATRHGFAPSRRLNVNAIGLPVPFGQLLHALISPQSPVIEIAASQTDDEVNQPDGITERARRARLQQSRTIEHALA